MKKHILKVIAFSGIIALFSCSGNQQQALEATDAQEVMEISGEASLFQANLDESIVTWIGSKPAGKHNGTINITDGSVSIQNGQVAGGSFTMDITSLRVLDMPEGSEGHTKLSGHLMSADFFDAANYAMASFEITSVEPYSSSNLVVNDEFETENKPLTESENIVENPNYWVSGNLTLRGTTKNIRFPANISIVNNQVSAAAKFNIDRTNWGLMYGDEASVADKVKDSFIYNTVNVGFELKANK
jgi:polyisoprenoid-binding protein YceI